MIKYIYKPKQPLIPISLDGFYSVANVMAITGWSRTTLYLRMDKGLFPKPDTKPYLKVGWKTSKVRKALGL